MWHWSKHVHMHTQWANEIPTKRRDEASSTVYSGPCSTRRVKAFIWNSMQCISRYTYDVNITLHLVLLNTFGVCSFITLSVFIKQNELNRLSLPFAPQTEFYLLSEESIPSRGVNVFALACGKQQINVTESRLYQLPAKTQSETLSSSSVCCILWWQLLLQW